MLKNLYRILTVALLIGLVLHNSLFAQSDQKPLAKAGTITITAEEFKKRFEMTPHPKTDTAFDSATVKLEFLYTLVAEKLLAQTALREKIFESDEVKNFLEFLRKSLLRDMLYQKEIKNKIVVTDSALAVGKERILRNYKVKFIFSNDEKEITEIYNSLVNGARFDSILSTRPEYKEQSNSADVTFGSMHPLIEEEIYKLLPGQFTPVIELQEGWYICKVYEVTARKSSEQSDLSKVKKVIESRVEDKIYEDFYKKFFKGVNINADRKLFEELAQAIVEYIGKNKDKFRPIRGVKFKLRDLELNEIKRTLDASTLSLLFIKFPKNPVSLGKFISQSTAIGFEFDSIELNHVRSRLNNYVFKFIQNELLAREAEKRGYEKEPAIVTELKTWREYYLAKELMKKIFKEEEVSDDEAYNYFASNEQKVELPDSVKFEEIAASSLETVELILDELGKGTQPAELAEKLSGSVSYYPALRFLSVNEAGAKGEIALGLKPGEVYGPIKIPEGYSVIKLVEKKKGERVFAEAFEEAKADIKNMLRTKKMFARLDEITARAASELGISINNEALDAVKVTNVNMLVIKRFGFGGQIIAAPYSPLYSSWYRLYKQKEKERLP